jgi:hypothetical protein
VSLAALNTVRTRLVLLFFAITAASVGFVYLYVVPQLESNLTAEKLTRLESKATRATRAPPSWSRTHNRPAGRSAQGSASPSRLRPGGRRPASSRWLEAAAPR